MNNHVALESTVISHGLPYPENLHLAKNLETIVRREGAVPKTIGIIEGEVIAGLNETHIERLATAREVRKVSLRDLPIVTAKKNDGATTVAATMWAAQRHDIPVFATGGIGGVHRSPIPGAMNPDVSADMEALGTIPVTVVCAGPKSILDLAATREMLETRGVTLIGYQTDEMPAFYSRRSGLPVDVRCDSIEDMAGIVAARRRLGLRAATLVVVPIDETDEIPADRLEPAIQAALIEANATRIQAAELTPFLLAKIRQITNNHSLHANIALLERNAQIAAKLARILHEMYGKDPGAFEATGA